MMTVLPGLSTLSPLIIGRLSSRCDTISFTDCWIQNSSDPTAQDDKGNTADILTDESR